MTKFNKSLLTAAVVGALSLAGAANAADLYFGAPTQITYAKDLIVNNGTTIQTPANLQIAARSTQDGANVLALAVGDQITVKVTLTNDAKFDATADAKTLVEGFVLGDQLGAAEAGEPLGAHSVDGSLIVGNPYYSASGQELNFTFVVPTTAVPVATVAAPAYFLELNSFQITNLVTALGKDAASNSSVSAEITIQNNNGAQFLAAAEPIAKSKWGLETAKVDSPDAAAGKKIDVAGDHPKFEFAPTGVVGQSDTHPAGYDFFNLGGVSIYVAEADEVGTGAVGASLVNNFNAVAANPVFNVLGTSEFKFSVTGSGLNSFFDGTDEFVWLSDDVGCAGANDVAASSIVDNVASFTLQASSPLLANVTASNPGASDLYVCAGRTGAELSSVETVNIATTVDYKLPTQRINPTLKAHDLVGIEFNGTTLIFQNVNPASNNRQQSQLRLTNNNANACNVEIDAKDDAGLHASAAKLTLGAHKSIQLESPDLENGNSSKGVTGGFGDGTGKWYVRVTAQCTNFKASALNRNNENGTVTNLTAEKENGNEWLTPAAKLNP